MVVAIRFQRLYGVIRYVERATRREATETEVLFGLYLGARWIVISYHIEFLGGFSFDNSCVK